jgi:diguanylate cyclase (GGDEF)-like protein
MNRSELAQVEAAAVNALERYSEAREAFADAGEDPRLFAGFVTQLLGECDHLGLEQIPIGQALRAGLMVQRLRSRGLGLERLLELSMAIVVAISRSIGGERLSLLGQDLVLVFTRSYRDAEAADQREQQRELRALISISRAINRTLDPLQVAQAGLSETMQAMGLDAGAIWLFQDGAEHLSLVHTVGVPQGAREQLLAVDVTASEQVAETLRSGEALQFEVNVEEGELAGYRSALLVPLRGSHGPLGLLAVGSRQVRTFEESETGFVAAVADHLALALDHAFEHRLEAHTDYLTGLANRSEFESSVRRELMAAARHRRPVSLMLLDLDLLKTINDRFGHHAGDEAIRTMADVIRKAVRTSDISARLGGDEFAVAMPEAELDQAREVAGRVREALAERNHDGRTPLRLEVSFGLAQWQPGQDYGALFRAADRVLYQDKRRRQARRARQAVPDGRLEGSRTTSDRTSSLATH